MFRRYLLLVVIIGSATPTAGCTGSGQNACPSSKDGGAEDLGAGPESRPCRSDDNYFFWIPAHMSADRRISVHRVEIAPGWNGRCYDYTEMVSRLLTEDGTILGECGDSDVMLCAGNSCSPYPHPVDFDLAIQLVPGAAFYELTDNVSGKPPIRIDLRGHVQLFCMNAPCELDVCKPLSLDGGRGDVSNRGSGAIVGDAFDLGP